MSKLAVMFGTLALICVVIAIAVRPASVRCRAIGRFRSRFSTLCCGVSLADAPAATATGFDYGAPIVGVVILTLGMLLGGPLFPQHAQPLANEFIAAVIVGMDCSRGRNVDNDQPCQSLAHSSTGVAIWLAGCCAFLGTQVWFAKMPLPE